MTIITIADTNPSVILKYIQEYGRYKPECNALPGKTLTDTDTTMITTMIITMVTTIITIMVTTVVTDVEDKERNALAKPNHNHSVLVMHVEDKERNALAKPNHSHSVLVI
ncbi:1406_t:CDS:2, partial [Gigaspora margarita]